jgi:hypothetical protein
MLAHTHTIGLLHCTPKPKATLHCPCVRTGFNECAARVLFNMPGAGGGTVLCCGDNTWGQCGLPFDTARVTRLTPVLGIPSNITAVAAGLRHSLCLVLGAANQQQCGCCAASSGCGCDPRAPGTAGSTAAGAVGSAMVYAWGSNRHQQLGCREAPAAQTPPPSIHSVADQAQAGAACIGRNTKPKQKQAYWQPAPLQLLSGVQQVRPNAIFDCLLLWSWTGSGNGCDLAAGGLHVSKCTA